MPEITSETILKPKANFISWTTGNSTAREDAISFDKQKGNPVGGMLVKSHVDGSSIIWDINAVIGAARQHYDTIAKYNESAAPGMAISNSNIEYLSKKAQDYNGKFEVITTVETKNVLVEDKWTFENNQITWLSSKKEEEFVDSPDADEPEESIDEDKDFNLELDEGMFDFISKLFKSTGDAGKEWAQAIKTKYEILNKILDLNPESEYSDKIKQLSENISSLFPTKEDNNHG